MPPLTRGRTGGAGIPDALVAEHYAQRASAGLLIAEATAVSREGDGWPGAPEPGGIFMRDMQMILRNLRGLNVVGGDVCEVAPLLDPYGLTALNAANLILMCPYMDSSPFARLLTIAR